MSDENSKPNALAMRPQTTTVAPAPTSAPRVGLLRPIATDAEFNQARHELRAIVMNVLVEGRDYVTVPGNPKPFLSKAGAENVMGLMGCRPSWETIEQEIDHDRRVAWVDRYGKEKISFGLYRQRTLCRVIRNLDDKEVGSGRGAASTMESKYISRPRDCENTVLKMADKRAYVAAALFTFGLSDMFSQDEETIDRGDAREAPSPRPKHTTQPAPRREDSGRNAAAQPATTPLGWERIHATMGELDGAATLEELKEIHRGWQQAFRGPLSEHVSMQEHGAMHQYVLRCAASMGGPAWNPTDDQAASVELLRSSKARAAPRAPDAVEQEARESVAEQKAIVRDVISGGGDT